MIRFRSISSWRLLVYSNYVLANGGVSLWILMLVIGDICASERANAQEANRSHDQRPSIFPRARIFFPLAVRSIRVSLTDYNLPASCLPRQFIFAQLPARTAFSANVRLLGDEPGRGLQLKLIWLTFWKQARTMVRAQPEMLLAMVSGEISRSILFFIWRGSRFTSLSDVRNI